MKHKFLLLIVPIFFSHYLITMETKPKLLIYDDKFPVYTRDFINEEIRAIITSNYFTVSLFAQETITNPQQLAKLPTWMKSIAINQLATMPDDLDQYALIFACWGNLGEKIAQLKHQGRYHGKLVTRFRGSPEERIGRPDATCYPYLKQHGDLCLPNCDFFRKQLCEHFGFNPSTCVTQYESVDVDAINRLIAQAEKQIPTSQAMTSLVSICRLEQKKGLDFALYALAQLRIDHPSVKIHYTIVGDGSQKKMLKRLIQSLELQDMVTMVGGKNKQEVMFQLISNDILLAPSYTPSDGDVEGIMNILKEAGLAGTIVVGTDHAGTPELIVHDKTGVIATQDNINDLAEMIIYAIDQKKCWPLWRAQLKKEIEERFNSENEHKKLIKILGNMIHKGDS